MQVYRIVIPLSILPPKKIHKSFTFSDLRSVNPSDIAIIAQIHEKVNVFMTFYVVLRWGDFRLIYTFGKLNKPCFCD